MPQDSNWVATRSDCPDAFLFNLMAQAERTAEEEEAGAALSGLWSLSITEYSPAVATAVNTACMLPCAGILARMQAGMYDSSSLDCVNVRTI